MKIAVNAGHAGDEGAAAHGQVESQLNAVIAKAMMTRGRELGQTMINATTGGGYPDDVNDAIAIVNSSGVDLAISNHFNAGGGTGVEVLYYPGNTAMQKLAAKISAALAAAYGLPDRGAVARSDLGFLRWTKPDALMIEWGFIDAPGNSDAEKIMADPEAGVNAVFRALGITGGTYQRPVIVKKGWIVRNEPAGSAASYGTLAQDTQFDLMSGRVNASLNGRMYTWYEVRREGQTFWVAADAVEEMASSFLVRITGDSVIIRSGPGSNYADTQQRVHAGEVYTIVSTAQGQGGNGTWYKLKSGAGWISAAYAQRL